MAMILERPRRSVNLASDAALDFAYSSITCADLMSSLARIFSSNAESGAVSRLSTVNAVPPAWFRLNDMVAMGGSEKRAGHGDGFAFGYGG